MSPLRLFIDRAVGDSAQSAKYSTPQPHHGDRQCRAWWLIHERHELVWKSRHGATDANSTDVRTTANAIHPTAFGDVAIHHRPPATNLHQALGRSVFLREVA